MQQGAEVDGEDIKAKQRQQRAELVPVAGEGASDERADAERREANELRREDGERVMRSHVPCARACLQCAPACAHASTCEPTCFVMTASVCESSAMPRSSAPPGGMQ